MKPFLQVKKPGSSGPLRPFVTAAKVSTSCAAGRGDAGGASIELVKDGEKVVRMIIHCACGERMEVECMY